MQKQLIANLGKEALELALVTLAFTLVNSRMKELSKNTVETALQLLRVFRNNTKTNCT